MDDRAKADLKVDMVVDITTTGRRTGEPRRIEIWAHYIDGKVYITGSPGRRGWYANLVANPEVTLHLKGDVKADLQGRARALRGEAERRAILTKIRDVSQFGQRRAMEVDRWVEGSCLVEVTLEP